VIPATRHSAEVAVSPTREAAMSLAAEGVPVLPVIGKRPVGRLAPHGVHSATTEADIIERWWEQEPDAGVGMRTGQPGGIAVLDLDTLDAMERAQRLGWPRRSGWPETALVQTRRGYHLLLRTDEALPTFDPFPGATFKAEGGYVLAPPSRHPDGGRYRAVGGEPVDVFGWLMEAIAERESAEPSTTTAITVPDVDGPPIYFPGRNTAITSIAGTLHDGSRNLAQLEADLSAINAARCVPPLPEAEVRDIACKMIRRAPCKPSTRVTPEVLEALAAFEAVMCSHAWRGSGLTDRDVLLAIVRAARNHGQLIPAGVRVSLSYRDLALRAAVSFRTVRKAIRRLKIARWITQDNAARQSREAGAFILLTKDAHKYHTQNPVPLVHLDGTCVIPTRVTPVRWGGVGKKAASVLDALLSLGGAATVREIADALRDPRPWELKRRQIAKLAEAGIVVLEGDAVMLAEGWETNLDLERELRGEKERERADRYRYREEQRRFHEGRR
jgi:hypothetical protein